MALTPPPTPPRPTQTGGQPQTPRLTSPSISPIGPSPTPTIPSIGPARPKDKTALVGGRIKAPVKMKSEGKKLSPLGRVGKEVGAAFQMAGMAIPGLLSLGYGLTKDSLEWIAESGTFGKYKSSPDTVDMLADSIVQTFTTNPFRRYSEAADAGYAVGPLLLEDIGNVSILGFGIKGLTKSATLKNASRAEAMFKAGDVAGAEKAMKGAARWAQATQKVGKFATATDRVAAAPFLGVTKGLAGIATEIRTGKGYGYLSDKLNLPAGWKYGQARYEQIMKDLADLRAAEPDIPNNDPRVTDLLNKAQRAYVVANSFSLRRTIRMLTKRERYEADQVRRALQNAVEGNEINPETGEPWGPISPAEEQAIIALFNGTAALVRWFTENTNMTPEQIAVAGRHTMEPGYWLTPEGAELALGYLNGTLPDAQYRRMGHVSRVLQEVVQNTTQQAVEGYGRTAALDPSYLVPTPFAQNLADAIRRNGNAELIEAWNAVTEQGILDLPVNDPVRMQTLQSFVNQLPPEYALDSSMYPAPMRPMIEMYKRLRRDIEQRASGEVAGEPLTPRGGPPRGPLAEPMPPRRGRLGSARRLVAGLEKQLDKLALRIVQKTEQMAKLEQQFEDGAQTVLKYTIVNDYIKGMDIPALVAKYDLPEAQIVDLLRKNVLARQHRRALKMVDDANKMQATLDEELRGLDPSDPATEQIRQDMEAEIARINGEADALRAEMAAALEEARQTALAASAQADDALDGIARTEEELSNLEDEYEDAGGNVNEVFDRAEPLTEGNRALLEQERDGLLKRVEELKAEERRLSGVAEPTPEAPTTALDADGITDVIGDAKNRKIITQPIYNALRRLIDKGVKPYKPNASKKISIQVENAIFEAGKEGRVQVATHKKKKWWTDSYVIGIADDVSMLDGVTEDGGYRHSATKKSYGDIEFERTQDAAPIGTIIDTTIKEAQNPITFRYQIGDLVVGEFGDGQIITLSKELLERFDDGTIELFAYDPRRPVLVKRGKDVIGVIMPNNMSKIIDFSVEPASLAQLIDMATLYPGSFLDVEVSNKASAKIYNDLRPMLGFGKELGSAVGTIPPPKTISNVGRLRTIQGDIGIAEGRLKSINEELAADTKARFAPVEAAITRAEEALRRLDEMKEDTYAIAKKVGETLKGRKFGDGTFEVSTGTAGPINGAGPQAIRIRYKAVFNRNEANFYLNITPEVTIEQINAALDEIEQGLIPRIESQGDQSGFSSPIRPDNFDYNIAGYGSERQSSGKRNVKVSGVQEAIDAVRQELGRVVGEQPAAGLRPVEAPTLRPVEEMGLTAESQTKINRIRELQQELIRAEAADDELAYTQIDEEIFDLVRSLTPEEKLPFLTPLQKVAPTIKSKLEGRVGSTIRVGITPSDGLIIYSNAEAPDRFETDIAYGRTYISVDIEPYAIDPIGGYYGDYERLPFNAAFTIENIIKALDIAIEQVVELAAISAKNEKTNLFYQRFDVDPTMVDSAYDQYVPEIGDIPGLVTVITRNQGRFKDITSVTEVIDALRLVQEELRAIQDQTPTLRDVQEITVGTRDAAAVRPDDNISNPQVREAVYQSDVADALAPRLTEKMKQAETMQARLQSFAEYLKVAVEAQKALQDVKDRSEARLVRAEEKQVQRQERLARLFGQVELAQDASQDLQARLDRARATEDYRMAAALPETGNIPLDIAMGDIGFVPFSVTVPGVGEMTSAGPMYLPTGRPPKSSGRQRTEVIRSGVEGFIKDRSERYRDGDRQTIFNIREIAVRLGDSQQRFTANDQYRIIVGSVGQKIAEVLGVDETYFENLYEEAYQTALQYDEATRARMIADNPELWNEVMETTMAVDGVGAYAAGNANPAAVFNALVREIYGSKLVEAMELRGFSPIDPYAPLGKTMLNSKVSDQTLFVPQGFTNIISKVTAPYLPNNWTRFVDAMNSITQAMKTTTLVLSTTWQLGDLISAVILAQMTGVNVDTMIMRMKQVIDAEYGGRLDPSMVMPSRNMPVPTELGRLLQESPVQDISLQQAERRRLQGIPEGVEKQVGIIRRSGRRIADVSYRLNETINRITRHAYFLEKLDIALKERGMTLDDVVRDRALLRDPELRTLFFEVAEDANRWLGDFANLDTRERRLLTPIIPFYSWTKHIHKVFMALGQEHPSSIRWYLTIGSLYYDPEEDPMGIRMGMPIFGGFASTGFMNPLGDVFGGPIGGFLSGQGLRPAAQTLGPIPRLIGGLAGIDIAGGGGRLSRPPGTGVYGPTGALTYGGPSNVSEALGFTLQQFPIATRTMSALPALNAILPGEPIPENIPGTRIALGPVARYQTGEARTRPGFGRRRIEQPGGQAAAVARLFSLPFVPYRSEEQAQDIERAARARLRTLETLKKRRENLGPP